MTRLTVAACAALSLAMSGAQAFAAAAIDDGIDAAAAPAALTLPTAYALDTEMVVRNWVLCVSQAFAEQIVKAREVDAAAALKAYGDLKAAKSCGRFAELRVILQAPVYAAAVNAEGGAGAYSALVNFSGAWANAFVVYGGLPAE